MPTFRAVSGKYIWVPAETVMRAEQGEGGLTTVLHCVPPPGSPPGSVMASEVEGTVQSNGAVLDAALARFAPAPLPTGSSLVAA